MALTSIDGHFDPDILDDPVSTITGLGSSIVLLSNQETPKDSCKIARPGLLLSNATSQPPLHRICCFDQTPACFCASTPIPWQLRHDTS